MLWRHLRTKQIAASTHDGAGIEGRLDADARIIPENQAAKLQARIFKIILLEVEYPNIGVVVLEIRGRAARAEIAPVSDDRIAQKAVVALIAVAHENGI